MKMTFSYTKQMFESFEILCDYTIQFYMSLYLRAILPCVEISKLGVHYILPLNLLLIFLCFRFSIKSQYTILSYTHFAAKIHDNAGRDKCCSHITNIKHKNPRGVLLFYPKISLQTRYTLVLNVEIRSEMHYERL